MGNKAIMRSENYSFFHKWIVPGLHALLWVVAILSSNRLAGYVGNQDTGECQQEIIQLIPIMIVFLFELSISLFDVFSVRMDSYISAKFLRYVAIFILLIGLSIIPLFLFFLFGKCSFYIAALLISVVLKYMEMWLLANFDNYDSPTKDNSIGRGIRVTSYQEKDG